MQTLTQPTLLLKPFAESGDKNSIPVTNTDVTNPQLADLTNGFPTITSETPDNGGLPPERKDFNGLGYLTTTYDFFYQAGGQYTFNSTISTAIGGYPQGARLWYTDSNGNSMVVRSLIQNNTYNFVSDPSYIDGNHWKIDIPALSSNNIWIGANTFSGNNLSVKSTYDISQIPAAYQSNNIVFKDSTGRDSGYIENGQDQYSCLSGLHVVNKDSFMGSFRVVVPNTGSSGDIAVATSGIMSSIANWSFPNYSAAVSKTKGTSYTADSNGFLIGYDYHAGTGGANAYVYIDGVNVRIHDGQDNYSSNTWCYPISKGSSYSYSGSATMSMSFVPAIGG